MSDLTTKVEELSREERAKIVQKILLMEREAILADAGLIGQTFLDKLTQITMGNRNEIVLAVMRGLRPNPYAPWSYAEALTLESIYGVATVCACVYVRVCVCACVRVGACVCV